MFDPKALAVKSFYALFGQPEPESMPSTFDSERRSRSMDPLDKALAKWPGSVYLLPRDMNPRLAPKRQQPARQ